MMATVEIPDGRRLADLPSARAEVAGKVNWAPAEDLDVTQAGAQEGRWWRLAGAQMGRRWR